MGGGRSPRPTIEAIRRSGTRASFAASTREKEPDSRVGDFFSGAPEYENPGVVVLYATQWCRYCEKTRKLFAKHGISYIEYDIERIGGDFEEYVHALTPIGGRLEPGVPSSSPFGYRVGT